MSVCCDWLFQSELQEYQSKVKDLEAELQRANNKAYSVERQLTQLSLKVIYLKVSEDRRGRRRDE